MDVVEHSPQHAAKPPTLEVVAGSVVLDVAEHGITAPVEDCPHMPGLVVMVKHSGLAALDGLAAQSTAARLGNEHINALLLDLCTFEPLHKPPRFVV